MPKYNKMVLGIDQSYTKTGVSIACDGKLVKVASISFRGHRTKSNKRKHLASVLAHILGLNASKANECILIVERIRTFSFAGRGKDGKGKNFMNINYIKCTGALIATVVDIASEYGLEVYSVDTRSWKSKIVGTTKGGKMPTVKHVVKLGFKRQIISKNKKGKTVYDDDAADSACIALYGFRGDAILKREE